MKNIKKIFQISLFSLGLLLSAKSVSAQTISNHFFGENAWMPYAVGSTVLGGNLDKHWGDIKNSNASIIRYGGAAGDKNMPTNEQYVNVIDSIRANGMEPVIQVPFDNYKFTAQQAAAIVTYLNVTKGKQIKYWIIGNEPDLAYSFTNSSQVAAYIKSFSSAMKSADASIKIIGPECAWFNQGILTGLTTANGPDDITGKDEAGRYYLDVISFHTYPFNGTQTRDQVISKLVASGSFQDNLILLSTRVSACNTAHGRTGAAALKTAVTEANIDYQNPAGDNLQGVGANSFLGGQFIAEMMGIGMKNGLDFMNLWSVVEGNGTSTNIGYIDPATGNKKPAYYHFKLMAENFKGEVATCTTNQPTTVKSFGSKNGQQVSVLILNENLTGTYNYTVRLNTEPVSGANPLKINVNAGIAAEYAGSITNQASILLVFNAQGAIIKKYEYSLAGNAMANLAPTLTQFNATGIASNSSENGVFEIKNVYPNPAQDKFTLALSKGSLAPEAEMEVQIINLLGQEVYNKKLTFLTGKEEIKLAPDMANGEYIVRVKEGERDNYLVKKIIVSK
jgi:hypothetical protein